ncbi:Cys-tRNA(Pro) deacylase [Amnibacterium sp.]|uniref:Cys-tRNA(Pro) deacylase n=1 Tax=Amnibacterium sp. TaxID=1872496 RepID=UPI00263931A3|nr:Cys-tRNA(Pro) deacylase [Amnibacterium sp.]MCU1472208.1 ybaK [Amnibacterium sp.]
MTSTGTPATVALTALGIPFVPHPYRHDAGSSAYGIEAAAALGVDPARVLKTLVAAADDRLVVAVVPVSTTLDLKALAAAAGAKRAVLAEPATAERRTGYVIGGISPLGQRARLPLYLDASALGHPTVFVSGGRRGFDIELAPADLLAATGGTAVAIAR